MPDITYRTLERKDCRAVVELDRQSFPPELAWTDRRQLAHLFRGEHIGVVATLKGLVVGYLILDLYPEGSLTLLSAAVLPGLRRQGVASGMLAKALTEFTQDTGSSARYVRALVHEDCVPAQLWLRELGFRCIKSLPDRWKTGRDGYLFLFREGPSS